MKVFADQSKCAGHAQCAARAPEVFLLDDDGYISFDGELTVPDGQEAAAKRGVDACPERVLTVVSED
jgi:ferredoxin